MKVTELMRSAVEAASKELLEVYFSPLGLEIVNISHDGDIIVRKKSGGGLKLVGISKDGDVNLSPYEDAMGKVKIAEMLHDRVYGKPRQSTEITGSVGTGRVDVPRDQDRGAAVAAILAEAMNIDPAPAIDLPDADVVEDEDGESMA